MTRWDDDGEGREPRHGLTLAVVVLVTLWGLWVWWTER